jgi:uroporphyrinogen-III synthase
MQQNKIAILSTRPLEDSLIEEAKEKGIEIDSVSFIEIKPIHSAALQQEIKNALEQTSIFVFTSMNAVEAVAAEINGQQSDRKVYCIGNTTRRLAIRYFGERAIAGTADSATALAWEILNNEKVKDVIFFCGDHRRDELPDILNKNNIGVKEIVVYQTVSVVHKIEKHYDGILFFSPSAVESFFSNNETNEQTILFAIGNTTANAIKKHSNNKIIISDNPGKENLVRKVMEYFTDL